MVKTKIVPVVLPKTQPTDNEVINVLTNETDTEEESSDDELQAPIIVKKPKRKINITEQDKKRRSDQLKIANKIRLEAVGKRREIKMSEDERKKKEKEERIKRIEAEEEERMERLIIRKALSIKKKAIKDAAVLEKIKDDDTPLEEIKEILKKKKQPQQQQQQHQQQPSKPRFTYL